jgi:hypothetical protein
MKPVRLILMVALTLVMNNLASVCNGQAALLVLILGDKVATEKFHLSIDAALNLANYPGMEGGKIGGGANFGLGTHIKLGEKWSLKPELKPLSRKKVRSVDPITPVPGEIQNTESKLSLNYLDIPVFLQYNISHRFFVSAGPQVSFLTKADQFSSGKLEDGKEAYVKIDAKSFFNSVDLSFPLEAGYSLMLASKRSASKMNINIFARYEYGFLEVFKDPSTGSSRISMFQIGASLPFIKAGAEGTGTGNN